MTVKPLQVTNKPRCTARVPNMWFHYAEFGADAGPDHQCPFPIWRNGRCKRHSPHHLLPILEKREKALAEKLEKIRAEIAIAYRAGVPSGQMENPS